VKVLHTSDWHLGRQLNGRTRYAEFEAFLNWLGETIQTNQVEMLLVAGDIFDTGTPSNRAQELYYRFLDSLGAADCRHVVIVAGNHDSPSFLDAPKTLLRSRDVHVIGQASQNPCDDVLVLKNAAGEPELIVCAVPYLRDRDLRHVEAGESVDDKERKLLTGIRQHYTSIADFAEQTRQNLNPNIPIIATGHLFTSGGQTIEGDGVRDLYVGTAAHINASIFAPCVDYVALGHLHVPQCVNGLDTVRYSGSPLPMGFGEAKQQKSVCLVQFAHRTATVQTVPVPAFQHLGRIKGNLDTIFEAIDRLVAADANVWLEVVYDGAELVGDLREQLQSRTENTPLEILQIKYPRQVNAGLTADDGLDDLKQLDVTEVFERCMQTRGVEAAQQPVLRFAFEEILQCLQDRDPLSL